MREKEEKDEIQEDKGITELLLKTLEEEGEMSVVEIADSILPLVPHIKNLGTTLHVTVRRLLRKEPPCIQVRRVNSLIHVSLTDGGKRLLGEKEKKRAEESEQRRRETRQALNEALSHGATEPLIQKFENFFNLLLEDVKGLPVKDEAHEVVYAPLSSRAGKFAYFLDKFDIDLCDAVLAKPSLLHTCACEALHRMSDFNDTPEQQAWTVTFTALPDHETIPIHRLESSHLGKLVSVEAQVRRISAVFPRIIEATFDCPNCGNLIVIPQSTDTLHEPSRCICGRKGTFRMTDKKQTNVMDLLVSEIPEQLEGARQPQSLRCIVSGNMASVVRDRGVAPGTHVRLTGWVDDVPFKNNQGRTMSTNSNFYLRLYDVELMAEETTTTDITPDDVEKIKVLASRDDVLDVLTASVCPSIYAPKNSETWWWKRGIVLQMFGGVNRNDTAGKTHVRGDIHTFASGDPGKGKSVVLKWVASMLPRGAYVTGRGATGPGLTASVVKDEFTKQWTLEAGAMPLAHKGILCVDEFPRMGKEQTTYLNEGMEQQTIHINKAGINASLLTETPVVACGNPDNDSFTDYEAPGQQLGIPRVIRDRFDLIFPVHDVPNEDEDRAAAEVVARKHSGETITVGDDSVSTDLFSKYVRYAKGAHAPGVSGHCAHYVTDYYVQIRKGAKRDSGGTVIPMSMRQVDAMFRLAQAMARIKLRDDATRECAKVAIEMVSYCMTALGYNAQTGTLDASLYHHGLSSTHHHRLSFAMSVFDELAHNHPQGVVPEEDFVKALLFREPTWNRGEVGKIVTGLLNSGELYPPHKGVLRRFGD